jgi:hypothetical protein
VVCHIVITPVKVKSYLSVSFSSLVGITTIIILTLLTGAVWTNVAAHAQIFPITHTNVTSVTPRHTQTLLQPQVQQQGQPNLHLVKITSPVKGQEVPVGKNLRISGTATSNATGSNCTVSVKVNGVGRYHDVSPNGTRAHNDYSKWNFTLTPSYTAIKQGQNKITAKFSCINNPTVISHNSVNVTGVAVKLNSTGTNPASSNSTYPSSNSTNPASSNSTNPVTSKAISHFSSNSTNPVSSKSITAVPSKAITVVPSKSITAVPSKSITAVPSKAISASFLIGKNNYQVLSVSLRLDKNSIHPGDKQTITISVHDKNSSNPIAGASVIGRITSPIGPFKKIGGITDEKGKASYSWTVSGVDTTGKYKVTIEVSSHGYQKYSTTKTFKVTPIATTTPFDNYITSSPPYNTNYNYDNPPPTIVPSAPADSTNTNAITNNNNHHNHHNHLPTVIRSAPAYNANNNNDNPPPTPPPTIVPSAPADSTKIKFANNHHNSGPITSNITPNSNIINTDASKGVSNHHLITIPSNSSVTIPNSSSTPSTSSPVTIPNNNYNNNLTPSPATPSTTIPSTSSPVTIPNNNYNNNLTPSPATPSTSVVPKADDKTPFLLPFH